VTLVWVTQPNFSVKTGALMWPAKRSRASIQCKRRNARPRWNDRCGSRVASVVLLRASYPDTGKARPGSYGEPCGK